MLEVFFTNKKHGNGWIAAFLQFYHSLLDVVNIHKQLNQPFVVDPRACVYYPLQINLHIARRHLEQILKICIQLHAQSKSLLSQFLPQSFCIFQSG